MIPISSPRLLGNEMKYVRECIARNEISWHGKFVGMFEEMFRDYYGTDFAVTCCNGTAGLHLALLALGVGPGDDVFVPALTYISVPNAVRYVGANPVFCDIDPLTWCMDPFEVERAIKRSKQPRAMIVVHLYGAAADMTGLQSLATEHGLSIVEDAAEAHATSIKGQSVGSFGALGVFSFFANKLITTGEGGMVVTDNPSLSNKVRLYREQGQTPGTRFHHSVIGHNYRMTNLQAAMGCAQMEQFNHLVIRHSQATEYYRNEFGGEFEFQEFTEEALPWLFSLLVPKGIDRDEVMRKFEAVGVETRPVFPSMTWMPMYKQETPQVTDEISRRGISLPTHGSLDESHLAYIVDRFREFVR